MRRFFAAARFLTILPVPGGWSGDEKTLSRSVPFFPLVGLCLGLIAAGCDYAIGLVLPPLPASVLTVFILIGLSGGLHMDGLADTADGFFSARTRDRILEIMRDSRIGAMGVLAVLFVVLLKIALLTSVTESRWAVILLMPLAGRAASVCLMAALPYARPQGGLAGLFAGRHTWPHCLWAWGLLFVLSGGLARGAGLFAALLALAVTALFCLYNRKKLGGYTGDTLGAVCELAELTPLLAMVLSAHLWSR